MNKNKITSCLILMLLVSYAKPYIVIANDCPKYQFAKKYIGKNLYICFPSPSDPDKGPRDWYLFDHDKLLCEYFLEKIKETFDKEDEYNYPYLSKDILTVLSPYKL